MAIYDTRKSVCADRVDVTDPESRSACRAAGRRSDETPALCPAAEQASAACGGCDFDPAVETCTEVSAIERVPAADPQAACQPPALIVSPPPYSGPASVRQAVLTELLPFTVYTIQLAATTSFGTFAGASTNFRTLAAAPEGVRPVEVIATSSRSVTVVASPPVRPNGLLNYSLVVTGGGESRELALGVGTAALDKAVDVEAEPYTRLELVLVACSGQDAGTCSASVATLARTDAEAPVGVQPASLDGSATPEALSLFWAPPEIPRGPILQYRAWLDGALAYAGAATRAQMTRLRPHSLYNVTVEACNIAGCSSGPDTTFRTAEASPGPLVAPNLAIVDPWTVDLTWPAVSVPNGVLVRFFVLQNDDGVIGQLPPTALGYRASALRPFRNYTFAYAASTGGGTTQSAKARVFMPAAPPEGMGAARAVAQGRNIIVSWNAPVHPNGILQEYRVYRLDDAQLAEAQDKAAATNQTGGVPVDTGRLVYRGGPGRTTVIEQVLRPHHTYHYAVVVENQAGIGFSRDPMSEHPPRPRPSPRVTCLPPPPTHTLACSPT